MQRPADTTTAVAPGSELPDADNSAPAPPPRRGLRAGLRRTAMLSATKLVPALAADRLARRYLTAEQAVIDDLAKRRHRFEVLDLGQDTALLRATFPAAAPGAPRVLIVPGHDGHFRQFTRVARALQKRGAALDMLILPGHGYAARRLCSLHDMVESLRRAVECEGPYHGIVAHCVAAHATLRALDEGVTCDRVALVSVPLDLPALVRLGGRQYGLSGRCLDLFVARVNALGAPYAIDRDWRPIAEARREALLIVQARNDYAAPVENVRPLAQAWPGARMVEFDHGGHNGILNVTSAINEIAGFMVPQQG